MMGYDGLRGMLGFGGLGMVIGLLLWVGLIAVLVWAATGLAAGRRPTPAETALEILQRRYARGEISDGEYEQARSRLS